jgi:hypothetical protein
MMMPIHLSYKSLPELSALSGAERKRIWRAAVSKAFEHWQVQAGFLLTIPLMLAGYWLGSMIGHEYIGALIGGVIASGISERIVFRAARSHLGQAPSHDA